MYKYTLCGLPNVYLQNGYAEHEDEYGKSVSIDNLPGLHQAIGLSIVDKPGKLTGDEVRFLRKEMMLTQANVAAMIGINESTYRNWEADTDTRSSTISPKDRLIRILYAESIHPGSEISAILSSINELQTAKTWSLNFSESDDGWRNSA